LPFYILGAMHSLYEATFVPMTWSYSASVQLAVETHLFCVLVVWGAGAERLAGVSWWLPNKIPYMIVRSHSWSTVGEVIIIKLNLYVHYG
jgi:hypothetical protein